MTPQQIVSNANIHSAASIESKAAIHSKAVIPGEAESDDGPSANTPPAGQSPNSAGGMRRDVELAEGLSGVGIKGRLYLGVASALFPLICMGLISYVQLNAIEIPDDGMSKDDLMSVLSPIIQANIILLITGIIIGGIAAIWIAKSIVQPIEEVSGVTVKLANGNYDLEMPHQSSLDEVGEIARSVAFFRDQAVNHLEEQRQNAIREQERLESLVDNIVTKTRRYFDDILNSAKSNAEQMDETTRELEASSEEVDTQLNDFRSSVDGQNTRVQKMNKAIAGLTEEIQNISQSTAVVSEKCKESDSNAQETMGVFTQLENVTKDIREIIDVISDIAAQTNLLALNATIEAARAGEAGKGFAVVAGEVKSLANQTAASSNKVTELIEQISSVSAQAVEQSQTIRAGVSEINNEVTQIVGSISQQRDSAETINADMDEFTKTTETAGQSVETIAGVFQKNKDVIKVVDDKSSDLLNGFQSMQSEFNDFLSKIDINQLEETDTQSNNQSSDHS